MGYESVTKKGYVPKFKMKKLTEQSELNSPKEYDRIFKVSKPNWQDRRRWKYLMKHYKKGSLLDLGCLFSEIPSMMDSSMYTGVDLASEAVEEMQKRYPQARYEVGDIYNLPKIIKIFPYSYIVLGEVLEHCEYPWRVVDMAWDMLRPGGTLAISVPLEEAREPGAVDGDRHLWSFTKRDIINMIPPGAEIKTKILGSQYFPTYKYAWKSLILWAKKK